MGNIPELVFVVTVATVLAIVGLFCLVCFVAFILTVIHEWRKQNASRKISKARDEITKRERRMERKTGDEYWKSMMSEIDKEYRGIQ
jgi:uncharacterized membrane protein